MVVKRIWSNNSNGNFTALQRILVDGYISANQIFTLHSGLRSQSVIDATPGIEPAFVRLLVHDPSPKPTCQVNNENNNNMIEK